jgi:hypothetical protein
MWIGEVSPLIEVIVGPVAAAAVVWRMARAFSTLVSLVRTWLKSREEMSWPGSTGWVMGAIQWCE